MKRYFLHILLVGVLGMLAVSCSDEYDSMGLDSRQAQVVFSVAMDTPVSRSRAAGDENTWGSDYTPSNVGDVYDNRIDINQFIVKIVDDEKEYKIKDIIKWKTEGAENVYKFVGVVEGIDQSTELTNPKVYVYANMGTTEPAETFSQNAANIPMWGVKSIQGNKTFAPGTRVDLEEIALLRAMAKLEVSLNAEMAKEFALTGATLNKHNSTGYTLPMLSDAFNGSTEDLSLEGVLRPKKDNPQGTLALASVVTDSSYVVYLPEVKNEELKITVQLRQKKVDASGNVTYGSEEEGTFSLSSDVVRNHWYKYNITGFAASQIQVNYEAVPWTNVNIELGGDGFLFLNKDVIEIYNSNIDTDQLTFASSSPIASIELVDLYNHNDNGNIVEGTTDGVSAYYISKYGQKIQLGTDPGFDISDKQAVLAKEAVILSNISATAEANTLNGGITIKSPFLAEPSNEIPELQQNSHYDTPRYLEFLVTNMQGSKATFRVIQYPPVVITNEEGYFSYRSDQKFSDDQEEASHYHNYMGWKSFHLTGLMWGYEFDWTNVPEKEDEDWFIGNSAKDYGDILSNPNAVTTKAFCEVLHYGNLGADHTFIDSRNVVVPYRYGGLYKSTTYPTDAFLRHRYYHFPGGQTDGIYKETKLSDGTIRGGYRYNSKYWFHNRGDVQGLAVGPYYERDGRTYRKQFAWNIQPIFYNLYVSKVYDKDENGKLKGQADLNSMTYSVTMSPGIMDGKWVSWGKQAYTNHRMYIVRTTTSSSEYNVGHPTLTDEGVTENTVSNANMISPKFAVASQLGETRYQSIITLAAENNYKVPVVGEFYKLAVEHCREYVETTYIDKDGDHEWDSDETVIHYDDWRLPTKAEINAIINYQNESRAMDRLLVGQYYFCAAGADDDADVNVQENWVSNEVAGYSSTGYYIRCVRDVKPEGQNGFIGK